MAFYFRTSVGKASLQQNTTKRRSVTLSRMAWKVVYRSANNSLLGQDWTTSSVFTWPAVHSVRSCEDSSVFKFWTRVLKLFSAVLVPVWQYTDWSAPSSINIGRLQNTSMTTSQTTKKLKLFSISNVFTHWRLNKVSKSTNDFTDRSWGRKKLRNS